MEEGWPKPGDSLSAFGIGIRKVFPVLGTRTMKMILVSSKCFLGNLGEATEENKTKQKTPFEFIISEQL